MCVDAAAGAAVAGAEGDLVERWCSAWSLRILPVDPLREEHRQDVVRRDRNKRTALAVTIAFCDVNGFDWLPPAGDDPDGEETYQLMLAIAAAPGAD